MNTASHYIDAQTYMMEYKIFQHEFEYVRKLCLYLNREIPIHEVTGDFVRNRDSAIEFIEQWNTRINDFCMKWKSLAKVGCRMPSPSIFHVNMPIL